MPRLEVHIPISPNRQFLLQTHCLLESFVRFADIASFEPRFIVTVGADVDAYPLASSLPWVKDYDVEFRWVPRSQFAEQSFFATAANRFEYKFESDLVMMLDADTLVGGSLAELIQEAQATGMFLGMTAHSSPFTSKASATNEACWQRLFEIGDAPFPSVRMQHHGWGRFVHDPGLRYCPPYFNLGVLLAPAHIMQAIGSRLPHAMHIARRVIDNEYRIQLGVALALAQLGIASKDIGLKFNYPCTMMPPQMYLLPPEEMGDVRIFHYLGQGELDKKKHFADARALGEYLSTASDNPLLARFNGALRGVIEAIGAYYDGAFDQGARRAAARQASAAARRAVDAANFPLALDLLAAARDDLQEDGEWHYLQAFTLQSLGRDLEAARRHYDSALVLGFSAFWVLYNRAALELQLGQLASAQADLQSAIALDPAHPGAASLLRELRSRVQ